MNILRRTVAVLLFATALLPYYVRAEIEIEHYQVFQTTRCEVRIRGEITAADAEELANSNCPEPFVFVHNSPGGDVRAGMKIGRWIRENQAPIYIERDHYCYSTCALVFIAGVDRSNNGVVGLHRPYLTGSPQPKETIPALVSAMRDEIRTYVSEMGVRPEFASVMLETLPGQMRLYHTSEIHELVAERDAVYDEVEAARYARFYGISTDEYRRRRQEADEECDIGKFIDRLSDFTAEIGMLQQNCERAILWGLTQSVYVRRKKSIESNCGHYRSYEDLSYDQRVTKYRECRINVMRNVFDVSGLSRDELEKKPSAADFLKAYEPEEKVQNRQ